MALPKMIYLQALSVNYHLSSIGYNSKRIFLAEQCGNPIENKTLHFLESASSGNVADNKGHSSLKAGMLLRIKEVI